MCEGSPDLVLFLPQRGREVGQGAGEGDVAVWVTWPGLRGGGEARRGGGKRRRRERISSRLQCLTSFSLFAFCDRTCCKEDTEREAGWRPFATCQVRGEGKGGKAEEGRRGWEGGNGKTKEKRVDQRPSGSRKWGDERGGGGKDERAGRRSVRGHRERKGEKRRREKENDEARLCLTLLPSPSLIPARGQPASQDGQSYHPVAGTDKSGKGPARQRASRTGPRATAAVASLSLPPLLLPSSLSRCAARLFHASAPYRCGCGSHGAARGGRGGGG